MQSKAVKESYLSSQWSCLTGVPSYFFSRTVKLEDLYSLRSGARGAREKAEKGLALRVLLVAFSTFHGTIK